MEEDVQQPAHGSWQTKLIPAVSNQQLCSSAKPSGGALWPGNLGTNLDAQTNFAGSRAQFAHAQAKNWITAPPTTESIFQPYLTRKAKDNSWKLCGPVALELRKGQTESIVCRVKPLACSAKEPGVSADLRQQRILLVIEMFSLLCLCRESNSLSHSSLNTAFSLSNHRA